MLSAQDLRGLYAIIPTPAKADANRWDATDTVDLDETERLVNSLVADGVSGLIALGTTGECATLARSDYERFGACVLETVRRRIPTFIGTTALGGHETVSRMRFIRDQHADGTLLGLPMWQPLTTEMAVDFYGAMSDQFGDLAIMVYANSRAFRYSFALPFWEAVVRRAPTVIAAKYSRPKELDRLIAATGGKINFVPNEMTVHDFHAQSPATTIACWATAAAMGPAPAKAIMEAIAAGDRAAIDTLAAAIAWATAPIKPIVRDPDVFASFNIQVEKARINAAGYCRCGPPRPPYDHLPADYEAAARECGRRWAALCENHLGRAQFKKKIWEDEAMPAWAAAARAS